MTGMTVLCGLLVLALLWQARQHANERQAERTVWDKERGLLLTRIQAPELAPLMSPAPEVEDTTKGYNEEDEVWAVVHGDDE